LAEAGCKHIQVDEPYLTPPSDEEVRMAVEAINLSIEDLPDDMHVAVHVCQGNYAVGPHYDGQIGHRYFDTGRYSYCVSNREFYLSCGSAYCSKGIWEGFWRERR
jgi:5-methyltetrahydropteroyltriglutamate--homocysteine methyltransferase